MALSSDTLVAVGASLAVSAGGWVGVIATMKANLSGVSDRVKVLEEKFDKIDDRFVPRNELKALLDSIAVTVTDVKGLLQVALIGRPTASGGAKQV